jgi:hypothetical protein
MNITIYNTQDGKTVELRDIPNAPPMVSVNGVVQQPGTYRIVGRSVFSITHKELNGSLGMRGGLLR